MKKKIAVLLLFVSALMLVGGLQTVGASDVSDLAIRVDLYQHQYKAYSTDACYGTYKYIWGANEANSDHDVYFVAEFDDGSGVWEEDEIAYVLVDPGDPCPETRTHVFYSERDWRLKLDTWGIFKNSRAIGYIKNRS